MKDVKVLGPGCKRCITTADMVQSEADKLGVPVKIEKVTDYAAIAGYGIASTPGIVIDGKVVHAGGLPKPEDLSLTDLQGELEMEIAQLPPDEAKVFLEEYGIVEPSLNRMIRLSYDLLGLQSFFTVGPDEVRAWTVHRGAAAPEAAGEIHTDLQKGFIRAEIISFADFIEAGGETQAKRAGKQRLELKQYVVQDYDLVNFRFNK